MEQAFRVKRLLLAREKLYCFCCCRVLLLLWGSLSCDKLHCCCGCSRIIVLLLWEWLLRDKLIAAAAALEYEYCFCCGNRFYAISSLLLLLRLSLRCRVILATIFCVAASSSALEYWYCCCFCGDRCHATSSSLCCCFSCLLLLLSASPIRESRNASAVKAQNKRAVKDTCLCTYQNGSSESSSMTISFFRSCPINEPFETNGNLNQLYFCCWCLLLLSRILVRELLSRDRLIAAAATPEY